MSQRDRQRPARQSDCGWFGEMAVGKRALMVPFTWVCMAFGFVCCVGVCKVQQAALNGPCLWGVFGCACVV